MSLLQEKLTQLRAGATSAGLTSGADGRVRGFLRWWGQALVSWLPPRLRQALGVDRGRLLLQIDGDALQLRLQQGDAVRDLGRVPSLTDTVGDPLARLLPSRVAELPRWLLLAPASALRRRITLPSAAAERLRDVVGFEIDRQTPFSHDAVAYDARVLGRREGDGQLDVELVAVPRTALDPQLAALGLLAATLSGVDVAANDGAPLAVNLLAASARSRRHDPWRLWNWGFAALAVIALGLAGWTMLDNRRAAAEAFEQKIARQAGPAHKAAAARVELQNLIEGQAFLDRTRAERATSVEIINELSKRLPDSTYLEKLAIEDTKLTLIGLSSEAAALIGRLEGASQWREPALAGALQPDPATRRDRFTLTAELAPASKSPEAARAATNR